MDDGREIKFRGQLLEALGGIREGIEKLASDPEVEIQAGPAMCPHCGKENPTVTILMDGEASGPLGEWVLMAECHHCNHTFYGLVESWSMFHTAESLRFEIEQRAGGTVNAE
jgi:hypothetical protein